MSFLAIVFMLLGWGVALVAIGVALTLQDQNDKILRVSSEATGAFKFWTSEISGLMKVQQAVIEKLELERKEK